MAETVRIEIQLDDGSVKSGLAKIEGDVKSSASKIEKSFSSIVPSLSRGLLGIGATIISSLAVREVVAATIEQENAINNLNQALINSGSFSRQTSKDFQDFAAALQQVTGIGDEVILQNAALARQFTKTDEQARALVKTALDLSAATGISLESAIKNLGKTFSGLTGELGESVSEIRNLTQAQLKAGDAIDVVGRKFAGFAEAQGKTTSGQLQKLSSNFGDLLENIGKNITQSPIFINSIENISAALLKLNNFLSDDTTSSFSKAEQKIVDSFNRATISVVNAREEIERIQGLLEKKQTGGFLESFAAGSEKALAAQLKVANRNLEEAIKQEQRLSAEFDKILKQRSNLAALRKQETAQLNPQEQAQQIQFEQLLAQATQARIDAQIASINKISLATERQAELKALTEQKIANIESQFLTRREQLQQQFNDRRIVSQKELDALLLQLETEKNIKIDNLTNAQLLKTAISAQDIKNAFVSAFADIDVSAQALGRTLQQNVVSGFTQAFAAIGNSLATGKNAFESFGKSIYQTLGSIAIQLGQFFILVGTGITATGKLLGLSGGAAIAAGIGLQVFGGFLQGLGGGGGGVAGAGGGGAGGTGAGGEFQGPETPGPEDLQNNQRVQLVIQGDVFDSDETGTRIASILTEKFQAEGVDVVRAV